MSETTLSVNVSLTTHTCYCGFFWATPRWITVNPCPNCAERRLLAANDSWDDAVKEQARLSRRISSLQGVITKMKGRRAR